MHQLQLGYLQGSADVLGPDAFKAFEMNKSDGGKQCLQHDTVIPETNLVVEHRGKVQKMTLPDGRPKGLECVLIEHGFDVHKMHAKCALVVRATPKSNSVDNVRALQGDATVLEKAIKL